jgi:hypothetical protein
MGQKIGKAVLVSSAEPFGNLSRKSIVHIWQVYFYILNNLNNI